MSSPPAGFEPRFRFVCRSVVYTVGLADLHTLANDDNHKEGLTVVGCALIAINYSVAETRRPVVFCHEVVHGIWGEDSVSSKRKLFSCRTDDLATEVEEDIACSLAPGLLGIVNEGRVRKLLADGRETTKVLPWLHR